MATFMCRWLSTSISARKVPFHNSEQRISKTFSARKEDLLLIYNFQGDFLSYSQNLFLKVERDHEKFLEVVQNRQVDNSQSLLQQISVQHPNLFANLPDEVLVMNIIFTRERRTPPAVELSTVGGFDYVMFEVVEEKVTLVESQPENTFVFNTQPCHISLGDQRPMHEIKLSLRHKSYLVLGCKNFWSIMIPELILPLLEAERSIAQKVEDIMNLACVRYLMTHVEKPFREELAEKVCHLKKIFNLSNTIFCTLVVV